MKDKLKMKFNVLAVFCILIFCFALTPITFQNDTYYTIKIGEHIVQTGEIDMQDPFSWHEDLPYTYNHWLYDVSTYLVYDFGENIGIGGFCSLYIATIILCMILGLVIYFASCKLCKNQFVSFFVTMATMYLLKNFIAARAQLVTFILFALTILFIEQFISTKKKRYAVYLVIIPILIANLHCAVWPFYFVLFLPYIAEYIMASIIESDLFYKMQVRRFKGRIEKFYKSGKENQAIELEVQLEKIKENHLKVLEKERKRRKNPYKIKIKKETATKGLIVILFISVFTGLLTPLGTTPYTYLVKTMQGNTTNNISEHLPLTLINNIPIMVVLVMFLVILIFTDTKIKLRDLFMLSGLVLLAFMTRRQTSLLVLIGSFIFSKLVASMFEKYAPEAKNELLSALNNKKVDAIVILLVIIMSLGMYSGKIGNSFVSKKNYPVEATEWILQNLDVKNMKLFNEYNYGSYLLYKGVPVFIDSRADLYAPEFNGKRAENGEYDGRDIFTDFIKTSSMERYYEDTFEKYDITHIILKKKSKLNTFISNDSGFLEMYNDDNFVVYERCK